MSREPIITFYRLIEQTLLPQRADRSASGTLPMRAARYCDAITSAAGFGWWVFPPADFSLQWDGQDIFWRYGSLPNWMPLQAAQFPHLAARFDDAAPETVRGYSPPFLTALPEPGAVQIWSGLIARTVENWSVLIRGPANFPNGGGHIPYEGIVETDRWFGPLFINVRLTRTHSPVIFRRDVPLMQVQPLHRSTYADEILGPVNYVADLNEFSDRDWADYYSTIVRPNEDPDHQLGAYAVAARQRRKRGGCPVALASA